VAVVRGRSGGRDPKARRARPGDAGRVYTQDGRPARASGGRTGGWIARRTLGGARAMGARPRDEAENLCFQIRETRGRNRRARFRTSSSTRRGRRLVAVWGPISTVNPAFFGAGGSGFPARFVTQNLRATGQGIRGDGAHARPCLARPPDSFPLWPVSPSPRPRPTERGGRYPQSGIVEGPPFQKKTSPPTKGGKGKVSTGEVFA